MGTIKVVATHWVWGNLGQHWCDLSHQLVLLVFQCETDRASSALCFLRDVVKRIHMAKLNAHTTLG